MTEFPTWKEARTFAEQETRRLKIAHGIQKPGILSKWTVIMLPQPKNRYGHELACETVEVEDYP